MSGLTIKTSKDVPESPSTSNSLRGDVGEIDTRAPFQSVKAAVSLFGVNVSPRSAQPVTKRSKAEESVLEKETQHSMILREVECYKEQQKNAEATRAQAQRDLERANRTLQQLTNKLETLTESKQASIEAAEAAKIQLKELEQQRSLRAQRGSDAWKADIESEREAYKACTGELIAVKQNIADLRRDIDAALQEQLVVFQKIEDAEHAAKMVQEKKSQMLEEVTSLRETLNQVKQASLQAQEEHIRIITEKETYLLKCKSAKEVAEKELMGLREEMDEPKEVIEQKLEETMYEVRVFQDQLNEIQASDLNSIKNMASELDFAKKKLEEILAEENSIRSSIEAVKQQLEKVKEECAELEQKKVIAEATLQELHTALGKRKPELVAALSTCDSASLKKLPAEAEEARQETKEYKKSADILKQEVKEAEENLDEAKAAQKLAEERMHNQLSASEASTGSQDSGPITKIRLSVEELESMKKKIKNFGSQADVEVATAKAQVESINASKDEASQKLEEVLRESEALQSEIDKALKRAELAEAAKGVVDSELQKRSDEQNEAGKII